MVSLKITCKEVCFVVKLLSGGLNLNKNKLIHTIFQGFFPDYENTNFSEPHVNGSFCSGFIFSLQCSSPANNAKSFRAEMRL